MLWALDPFLGPGGQISSPTRDSESVVGPLGSTWRRAMDSALAAALLPLGPSPRLSGLGAKLATAGVVDCRVLADLLRVDAYEVISDFLILTRSPRLSLKSSKGSSRKLASAPWS